MTIKYTRGTIPGRGLVDIAVLVDDTHLSRWVEQGGKLDHDNTLVPRILDLIPPGSCVVDAGAFLGDHTAAYATRAGQVFAFEPNPESFECLMQNCGPIHGVHLYCCGLSDGAGHVRFRQDANVGASRIAVDGSISVSTCRLDDFHLCPSLVKMDVEGFEVRALMGARETVERCQPVLVLEVNRGCLAGAGTSPEQLFDLLACWGYECRDIHSGALCDPRDERGMFDIVCRHGVP